MRLLRGVRNLVVVLVLGAGLAVAIHGSGPDSGRFGCLPGKCPSRQCGKNPSGCTGCPGMGCELDACHDSLGACFVVK